MSIRTVLVCAVVMTFVHTTVSDTGLLDAGQFRQKRDVQDLLDTLTKSFSRALASIFDLDPEDFEDLLRGLGRLGVALAKRVLKEFEDRMDAQFDFGSVENSRRVSMMMESLQQGIEQQEQGTTTASSVSAIRSTPFLPLTTILLMSASLF